MIRRSVLLRYFQIWEKEFKFCIWIYRWLNFELPVVIGRKVKFLYRYKINIVFFNNIRYSSLVFRIVFWIFITSFWHYNFVQSFCNIRLLCLFIPSYSNCIALFNWSILSLLIILFSVLNFLILMLILVLRVGVRYLVELVTCKNEILR